MNAGHKKRTLQFLLVVQKHPIKHIICCALLLLSISWNSIAAKSLSNVVNAASQIQVNIEEQDGAAPSWKLLWDQARQHTRNNNFSEAKDFYQALLNLKPNIVEARWEYCKLLISIDDFTKAARVIEGLLELEPNHQEYLITAGELALINKHFNKAVRHFGQVYENSSFGQVYDAAIKGLVKGFQGLGKEQSAYSLLEQYYQRNTTNLEILADLAPLSKKLGYNTKARFYYSRLAGINPTNKEILATTAQLYEDENLYRNAAVYWIKYLELEENYLPFHRKLSQYYLEIDKPEKALPHFIKIYKQDQLSTALALQIGEIYATQLNRPDKALLYFEQYSSSFPFNDKVAIRINKIRNTLAQQYLPIVENDAANQLWQDLDMITLNKEKLFLVMADALKRKNKIDNEVALIEILHNERPADLDLTYRLALLYNRLNKTEQAYLLLLFLDKQGYDDKSYLLVKAELELNKKLEVQSLGSYVRFFQFYSDNLDALENIIIIAGNLGLMETLNQVWEQRPMKLPDDKYLELSLRYIESLRNNSLFASADKVYEDLLNRYNDDNSILPKIYFHRSDSLYQEGLVFEAEQLIRQVLARDLEANNALQKLVTLSIQENRYSQARSWLNLLAKRIGVMDFEEVENQLPDILHFLYVAILMGEREFDDAEELVVNHQKYTSSTEEHSAFKKQSDQYLAKIYYNQQEYDRGLKKLATLRTANTGDDELYVIEDIIKTQNKKTASLKTHMQHPSLTQEIDRAKQYDIYGNNEKALVTIDKVLDELPDSIRAKLVKVDILSSLAQYEEALELIASLNPLYADKEFLERRKLELEFKSGNFAEIVKKVPPEDVAYVNEPDKQQESSGDVFFWRQLLLARALWAENRREEAIEVYDRLLAVPVDTIFLEKMEVQNVNFNLPPLKKSLLNVITFTNPGQPDPITAVMDPQFFTQNIGQPVDDIAAGLYGKYRWQRLIRKELSARQAIEERDYYRAEKEYLALIKEEKSEETLFDLAYIYNKLGYYGKEAELYEILKKKSPLYPGLDEYIDASVLKRQPRISGTFINSRRKGRDGYINMKKRSWGFEGWLMPTFDQEIKVGLFRNAYSSFDREAKTDSNRLEFTYSTYFEDSLDLNVGIGTDNPTDSGTTEVLYKFEIITRLSDSVEAYGRFEQDLVEDTIRSVTESIVYRDLEAGFKFDVIPRLFIGGDYRFRMYSDDNEQNRYKLWSMYHLFGELNQFKLKYSYENIRNNSENLGRGDDNFRNEFLQDDRVYWSPNHYWQHLFTAHYKYIFEVSVEPEAPLSYFSFDYSYGYEEDYNELHGFDVNIFLEMDRHFLLKGNVSHTNGDAYEETFAVFSLIYRW